MSDIIEIRPLRREETPSFRKAAIMSWLDAYVGLLPEASIADAPAMIDRAIAKRFDEFVVAILDGEVAGYYSLGEGNYFWHLYVDPAFQRRGIGAALHDAALAAIRARGFETAKLDVATANEKAVRFYRRHGWRETGRDFYEGLELIVLERSTDISKDAE
jgi:ribosomal protein S18 acetylase RimI-like enzyme